MFLLTGVGATLGVLAGRLARIVDRARNLEARLAASSDPHTQLTQELEVLFRRARLINRAITLCTTCALLVCVVIAALFVGSFLGTDLTDLISALFILAMAVLIVGFITFLREIFLATSTLRFGPPPH